MLFITKICDVCMHAQLSSLLLLNERNIKENFG